jgi:Na+/H+-dicarboxylate symporter
VIKPLGDLFLRLLKLIVMPLIFFTLVVGASSIAPKKLGRIGGKVIGWYFATSFIAASIGISIGLLISPGIGFPLPVEYEPTPVPSFIETFLSWIPENPFASLTQFPTFPEGVLASIIFALMFGIALTYLRASDKEQHRETGDTLFKVFDACAEIMYKIVRFVLEIAPYGVFALIAVAIGEMGISIFIEYGKIIGAAAVGTVIMILGIYSGILLAFKINPIKFFRGGKEAMLTAFVTRSSSGTLPVTMKCADENFGVNRSVYSFSLPIGATINMDGTAIYMLVVAVFAANIVGHALTASEIATLIVVAVMASVGVAGIPAGGLIMLTVTLSSVGLPLEVVGLIAGIDVILDMIRTMGNVTGDMACTTVVSKSEKLIDFEKGVWKKGIA